MVGIYKAWLMPGFCFYNNQKSTTSFVLARTDYWKTRVGFVDSNPYYFLLLSVKPHPARLYRALSTLFTSN